MVTIVCWINLQRGEAFPSSFAAPQGHPFGSPSWTSRQQDNLGRAIPQRVLHPTSSAPVGGWLCPSCLVGPRWGLGRAESRPPPEISPEAWFMGTGARSLEVWGVEMGRSKQSSQSRCTLSNHIKIYIDREIQIQIWIWMKK